MLYVFLIYFIYNFQLLKQKTGTNFTFFKYDWFIYNIDLILEYYNNGKYMYIYIEKCGDTKHDTYLDRYTTRIKITFSQYVNKTIKFYKLEPSS